MCLLFNSAGKYLRQYFFCHLLSSAIYYIERAVAKEPIWAQKQTWVLKHICLSVDESLNSSAAFYPTDPWDGLVFAIPLLSLWKYLFVW